MAPQYSFLTLSKGQSKANGFFSVLLVLITLLPGLAQPLSHLDLNLQPLLMGLAQTQPDTAVSVIVQKASTDNRLEQAVTTLGGTITAELPFINSFGAELPAKQVPSLATRPGIRWISLDAQVVKTSSSCNDCADTSNIQNYSSAINADKVWNKPDGNSSWLQGQGIGVAVLDSGVSTNMYDFTDPKGKSRVVGQTKANRNAPDVTDQNGHGTLVAGVIGSNGKGSSGAYPGVAPQAQIVSVKVSDDTGASSAIDVLLGLQWIYQNRNNYNIKVVNISFNSTVAQSYTVDPLDMGVEALWLSGMTVVVSAGNNGSANLFAPANDPFVITVGAVMDTGTAGTPNWVTAPFSAYGTDETGGSKPDLVAPGTHIISGLANNTVVARQHGNKLVSSTYMKVAGTSFSAPQVAGAAVLLLQSNPRLTPDQVKYRLKATALKDVPQDTWDSRANWAGYDPTTDGAGFLDVQAAVSQTGITAKANVGTMPNLLLMSALTASNQSPVSGSSVNWSSVNWSSVNWSSVNWSSVNWSSVNWSSVNWSSVNNYSDAWDS